MDFQPSRASELAPDLNVDRRDRGHKNKKVALKKVLTNMTMNNLEMLNLFPEINKLLAIDDLEIKKMCYIYLETYAKIRPEMAIAVLPTISKDSTHSNPVTRALALRTLSSVGLRAFMKETIRFATKAIEDPDAYVRKTAAYAVAKTWSSDSEAVEQSGLLRSLNRLLNDGNPAVVSAAIACLGDITQQSRSMELTIDEHTAYHLAKLLPEMNEWSQVYVLQNLTSFLPERNGVASDIINIIFPRLQHANTAVVLATIRLIIYLLNYVEDIEESVPNFVRKFQAPLVLLLTKPPEIQYVVLRNCILLLQSYPGLMQMDVKMFFSKFNDPIYIKTSKIEILYLLGNNANAHDVVTELRTWATDADVEASRRAIKVMARLALKVDGIATRCVDEIMNLVSTGVQHVVQESTIALQLIFRKFPDTHERYIPILLDQKAKILEDNNSKASLIWIIGQYPTEIIDAAGILVSFIENYHDEPASVQLVLLTASIKFYMSNTRDASSVVPRIFEVATQSSDDPDVRDRAIMYARLLSADPNRARNIVTENFMPIISNEGLLSEDMIEELLQSVGFLSSVYLRPSTELFRMARPKSIKPSPALAPRSEFRKLNISEKNPRDNIPFRTTTASVVANAPPVPPKSRNSRAGLDRTHSIMLTSQRNGRRPNFSQLPTAVESPALEGGGSFAPEDQQLIDI